LSQTKGCLAASPLGLSKIADAILPSPKIRSGAAKRGRGGIPSLNSRSRGRPKIFCCQSN
jgi:hypothetical protein